MVQKLDDLGYRNNRKKYVLIPTKRIVFLGLIIDTEVFKVFLTVNNCFQSSLRKTRQVGKGAVQHDEDISRDDLQKLYKHPRSLTPDTPLGLLTN